MWACKQGWRVVQSRLHHFGPNNSHPLLTFLHQAKKVHNLHGWMTEHLLNNIIPQINTTVLSTINFYILFCVLTVSAPFFFTLNYCVYMRPNTQNHCWSWLVNSLGLKTFLFLPQIKNLKKNNLQHENLTNPSVYQRLSPDRDWRAVYWDVVPKDFTDGLIKR